MDRCELTLSLNESVIEKAKFFAKANRTSLSKLIENYLDSLASDKSEKEAEESTPLVDSLCGIIELPENFDYKKARAEYLHKKYG